MNRVQAKLFVNPPRVRSQAMTPKKHENAVLCSHLREALEHGNVMEVLKLRRFPWCALTILVLVRRLQSRIAQHCFVVEEEADCIATELRRSPLRARKAKQTSNCEFDLPYATSVLALKSLSLRNFMYHPI